MFNGAYDNKPASYWSDFFKGWLQQLRQKDKAIRRKNKLINRLRIRIAELERANEIIRQWNKVDHRSKK